VLCSQPISSSILPLNAKIKTENFFKKEMKHSSGVQIPSQSRTLPHYSPFDSSHFLLTMRDRAPDQLHLAGRMRCPGPRSTPRKAASQLGQRLQLAAGGPNNSPIETALVLSQVSVPQSCNLCVFSHWDPMITLSLPYLITCTARKPRVGAETSNKNAALHNYLVFSFFFQNEKIVYFVSSYYIYIKIVYFLVFRWELANVCDR
jgi:hypothetical protein